MKRFISIDFLRGLSILLMLALHIFIQTFNTDILLNAVLYGQGSVIFAIFAVLILYFGSFAGLFMMLSGFGNIISMQKQYERNVKINPDTAHKLVLKSIVTRGLLIFLVGYFINTIFWPYILGPLKGPLLSTPITNYWIQFLNEIYWFQIIQSVGLAQIFLGIIFSICLKKEVDSEKIKKILWGIIIGIFVLTPSILYGIRSIPGFWSQPHVDWQSRSFWKNLLFFILTIIGGKDQAIFPWHTMVFIGGVMAIDLYKKQVTKKFRNKWLLIGGIMFLLGLVLQIVFSVIAKNLDESSRMYFEYGFGEIFGFSGPSSAFMLFAGGGEIILTALTLWFVEGKNRAKRLAENTIIIRRTGIITLTIFALQPLTFIPIVMLEKAFGLVPNTRQGTIWHSLAIIIICLMIWIPVIYTWEKSKFIGSFDWFVSAFLHRKRKDALNRLKPDEVLYEVEPLGEAPLDNEKGNLAKSTQE